MTLADAVLPLARTRSDVHRWHAADSYGSQLHDAVDMLERAASTDPPAEVLVVTQKAIASACKVIMRADDSSGIIGDAIRRLLALHVRLVRMSPPPPAKLVAWMITFQFHNECDYFELDAAAYAPALGERGLASYRAKLEEIASALPPEPTEEEQRKIWLDYRNSAEQERLSIARHTRFVLEWNAQRLAVWDRDVEAIVTTHSRDRKVAAWFEDTAKALAEIGEVDLAIDWAKQATYFSLGHQSVKAAGYWCKLLAEHRPDEELPARVEVFRRWPNSTHAGALRKAAGHAWPAYASEVTDALERNPREAVLFALYGLDDLQQAWTLAHSLGVTDAGLWQELVKRYEKIDPLATLPVHTDLVHADLEHANAGKYRDAARRVARMRKLAAGQPEALVVDQLIADLRETHRRRPRLQQEFTRAGLP